MTLLFGDKLEDIDIYGDLRASGSRLSELLSDEVKTRMMLAIPGVPGDDYPILSSQVSSITSTSAMPLLN